MKPNQAKSYIYIYIYIGSISSLMQISLNIIDILCLHIFFWIREFERIQKKICRHKMSIMFNEICIYIYIYIYIYKDLALTNLQRLICYKTLSNQIIYIYIYNNDLELNGLHWLICDKIQPNQIIYI